jgi:hypothetical protein
MFSIEKENSGGRRKSTKQRHKTENTHHNAASTCSAPSKSAVWRPQNGATKDRLIDAYFLLIKWLFAKLTILSRIEKAPSQGISRPSRTSKM